MADVTLVVSKPLDAFAERRLRLAVTGYEVAEWSMPDHLVGPLADVIAQGGGAVLRLDADREAKPNIL